MMRNDQFLCDNCICWKAGVLVFMGQIKIATPHKKIVRADEMPHKMWQFFQRHL